MRIMQTNPDELQALRDRVVNLMRTADARIYGMTVPSWHGAFIEFPFTEGPISYAWTGYWEEYDSGSAAVPALRVGASPKKDAARLRTRMRADHARGEARRDTTVEFEGEAGTQILPFVQTESGLCIAEVMDRDAFVLIATNQIDRLPSRIVVTKIEDREQLITGWETL